MKHTYIQTHRLRLLWMRDRPGTSNST